MTEMSPKQTNCYNIIVDMLQCARQCSRRNSSQFLTTGEFGLLSGELRRDNRNKQHQQHFHTNLVQKSVNKSLAKYEVFLGGSCNPTTWRADIAIPALTQLGISYYNPQVSTWGPELMAAEHDAKESAAVLLFVVDSQTRCIAGMLEVVHLVAKRRCLVLVVHPFSRGQTIMGETLSHQELTDLSEGQSALLTLVRNQGVAVHTNINTALQCTIGLLRGPESTSERKLSEKLIKLREVFNTFDTNVDGSSSSPSINNNTSYQFQQRSVINTFNGLYSHQRYDVYLGGSSNKRTTWRQNIAIPLLKQCNITFYNPTFTHEHHENHDCHENSIDNNYSSSNMACHQTDDLLNMINTMNGSRIVLFVITNETRSITSMILASYYIAFRKNVVLCIQQLPSDHCNVGSETISKQAVKDYNRARAYLADLAKHESIPVFENIQAAVECAITQVQNLPR